MIKYVAMALGVLASTAVCGQSLEDRFREIENRLTVVERELARQAAAAAVPAPAPASAAQSVAGPEKWKRLGNWRALRRGMTAGEVSGLLGEPTNMEPGGVSWHYGPVGRVMFAYNQVQGWIEPR